MLGNVPPKNNESRQGRQSALQLTDKYDILRGINRGKQHNVVDLTANVKVYAGRRVLDLDQQWETRYPKLGSRWHLARASRGKMQGGL